MKITDFPQVHLNGVVVQTMSLQQSVNRVKNGRRVHYVPGRKKAKINGKRVPWKVAQNVLTVCLENGVMPRMEC